MKPKQTGKNKKHNGLRRHPVIVGFAMILFSTAIILQLTNAGSRVKGVVYILISLLLISLAGKKKK